MRIQRGVFLFLLLSSFLLCAQFVHPDFTSCYKKNSKLFFDHNGYTAYPVSKYSAIIYAPKGAVKEFIKFDPFLNLYLVKNPTQKSIPFRTLSKKPLGEWMAAASQDTLFIGNYAKKMSGFDSLAKIGSIIYENNLVMCLCCEAYGISATDSFFIDADYIKHFVYSKENEVSYGSLGVRFEKKAGKIVVSQKDPFCKDTILEVADQILRFDGKSVRDISEFKKALLFSKPGSQKMLRFTRDSKQIEREVIITKRFGGGVQSDTFLERFGLFFDADLKLLKDGDFGLKANDVLLQVDRKSVKDLSDIREIISASQSQSIELLVERDNFEFFVKIKK